MVGVESGMSALFFLYGVGCFWKPSFREWKFRDFSTRNYVGCFVIHWFWNSGHCFRVEGISQRALAARCSRRVDFERIFVVGPIYSLDGTSAKRDFNCLI